MIDLKLLREKPEIFKKAARNKNFEIDIDKILDLDRKRRDAARAVDNLRAEQNSASEIIAGEKDKDEKKDIIGKMRNLKADLEKSEESLKNIDAELSSLLMQIPNVPFDNVPVGKNDKDNVVLREVGKKQIFAFEPKDYMKIAKQRGWIDVERASKVSGSRFGYIKGELALLEFAIIRYVFDFLMNSERLNKVIQSAACDVRDTAFMPVLPPVVVKPEYMDAMGFLTGDIAEDMYFLGKDNLYLVGTSEQSIGPMHSGETFNDSNLPLRYVGFSTCFRREAGSYGKDTKGILRVHQFDKIEMISFCHPEKSRDEHRFLLALNEAMMNEFELPYRVVHISTGDMGLSKAEQFDIETWIPSENTYRETHSASNITDFQARRLNIKHKGNDESGYVHMLNATAFAIGRILIAIIENFQTEDAKVKIPKELQSYLGRVEIPSQK